MAKNSSKFIKTITHIDDMMIHNPVKYFFTNSTPFVRYKNNKFLTNYLDNFLAWNLFFLYLTDKVEFGQDILQGYVSSYHLDMWFFFNLDDFFVMVCTSFHEVVVCTRYIPFQGTTFLFLENYCWWLPSPQRACKK